MVLLAAYLLTPFALTQDPAKVATKAPEATELLGRAIKHYFDATSLAGTIKMTQSAKGLTIGVMTDLQFDRPNKMFLRQTRGGSSPKQMMTISDGKYFTYDKPAERLGPPRFIEAVTQKGYTQDIKEIYAASILACLDRSPVLDILISRRQDLVDLRSHLGSMTVTKTSDSKAGKIYEIEGLYMDLPGEEATGTFQATINEDGDLLSFGRVQRYMVPDKIAETIIIKTTWDVNVKVNVQTNPDLYNVRQ